MQHGPISDLLARGLEMTKEAVPMLCCHLVRDPSSQQEGRYRLVPSKDAGTFQVKELRGDKFESTYEQLKEEHFPSSALSQDVLCPVPIFPQQATGIPVFAAQATLIKGGLILSFCIMHLVADARTIFKIIKIWAQNCRHLQTPEDAPPCQQIPAALFEKKAFNRELDSTASLTDHG